MVPVKKPIIAAKAPKAAEPQKRRPRNTELNSSKKVGGFAAAVQKRYQSLNSSKSYDGYPYEEVSLEELAKQSRVSVPELNDIIKAFEDEKGCKVTKVLVSTERGGADGGDDWDGKSIIIQTDCGDFYWGTEDFVPVNSSTDQSVNCAEGEGASGLDSLVNLVKASNATDYDDKMEVLNQSGAYEEELMANAYDKAEDTLTDKYRDKGVGLVMLETSVRNGHGSVDAYTNGGEPGCDTISTYNFEDETEAVWDTIKSWNGDTAGLVDAIAQKVVSLVESNAAEGYALNSSEEPDSVNPSEKDAQPLNSKDMNCAEGLNCDASGISGAQDLLQKFVDDAASKYHTNLTLEWKPYSWKWSPEKTSIQYVIQEHTENSDGDYTMSKITAHPSEVQEFADSVKTFIRETVIPYLVDNAPEVDRIHGLFNDGISYLQLGDFDTNSPDVDKNDYEEEFDSSKNQSMNCAAGGTDVASIVQAALPNVDVPEGYRFSNPRAGQSEGEVVLDLQSVDEAGAPKLVDKIAVASDHGYWYCYHPMKDDGIQFGAQNGDLPSNQIETEADAVEWVTAALQNVVDTNLGGLDSSKNQSMNCSEGDSGTIYTDSGNEVAITDIKVVQNPETNALALFVPENGDDEIPEGFTVIGDVVATASGAPAIEENAETGDDSLNSSKKPPMNRAQRRAAKRGARRPKKR